MFIISGRFKFFSRVVNGRNDLEKTSGWFGGGTQPEKNHEQDRLGKGFGTVRTDVKS